MNDEPPPSSLGSPADTLAITCSVCGMTRPARGNFYRSPRSRIGYISICGECMTEARIEGKRRFAEEVAKWQAIRREREAAALAQMSERERAYRREPARFDAWTDEEKRREGRLQAGRALLCCNDRVARKFGPGQVVYGLVDPRVGALRYVGRSARPGQRLQRHLRSVTDEPVCEFSVGHWLRDLRGAGLRPAMLILEEVAAPATVCERASLWILHALRQGAPLTNSDARCPRLVQAVWEARFDLLAEPLRSEVW